MTMLRRLGPGLVSGAADDDPSGIATYAQAGAAFGYALSWTMLATLPMLAVLQELCARIGRISGRGLAANLKARAPLPILIAAVALLFIANTINLGADLGAIGEAAALLGLGPPHPWVIAAAVFSVVAATFIPYDRYVSVLKFLTAALLSYVGVLVVAHVQWGEVFRGLLIPSLPWNAQGFAIATAVFGTTISPYLFFWQSALEAEHRRPADRRELRAELGRIRYDTYIGMFYSNAIGAAIIIATAATLHARGTTSIATAAQAAQALRPVAGPFASALFALGLVGVGLLAVPVLAGSAAYAVSETFGKQGGLSHNVSGARAFYGTLALATVIGVALHFSGFDPIRALFWSAVINGIVAVPLIAVVLWLANDREIAGEGRAPRWMLEIGWVTFLIMAFLAVATPLLALRAP